MFDRKKTLFSEFTRASVAYIPTLTEKIGETEELGGKQLLVAMVGHWG